MARNNAAAERRIIKVVTGSTTTRPADTTAYAAGDLFANSTTAGSVTPMSFTDVAARPGGGFEIWGATLVKSDATGTNASFKLHLFTASPTVSNGDNGAIVPVEPTYYVGSINFPAADGLAFSTDWVGEGNPTIADGVPLIGTCASDSTTLYGLVEVEGTYTPASAETMYIKLRLIQH